MSDWKIQELESRIAQLENTLVALATGQSICLDGAGRPIAAPYARTGPPRFTGKVVNIPPPPGGGT